MLLMFFYSGQTDQNVIDEYHYKLIHLFHENLVHHIHEVGRGIGESKGHDGELILPIPSDKGCLGNVLSPDLNLMVPKLKINLGKELGIPQLV